MRTYTHTKCVLCCLCVLDSTDIALVITTSSDTVGIHSTVLLVCVAQGDPAASISWDFEGSIITNETSLRVSSYMPL